MSRLISLSELTTSFAGRYPNAGAGTVESLAAAASAEQSGQLDTLEAMAFKGLTGTPGKSLFVKAREHFYAMGEFVSRDDVIELPEQDARDLIRRDMAELASDADVKSAQKATK